MAGVVAAAALLAAAVVVVLVVAGGGGEESRTPPAGAEPDPVGTVIQNGEGTPPRRGRTVVVGWGTAPGVGPWQMEASRSSVLRDPDSGELYQPAGLRCLSLLLVDPKSRLAGYSGGCGEFPRTPGFSRGQVPEMYLRSPGDKPRRSTRPVLVYGRVPEQATAVVVTAPDGLRLEARTHEGPKGARSDFYAISVRRGHPSARINWLDENGKPGSRGIGLMPPITRR